MCGTKIVPLQLSTTTSSWDKLISSFCTNSDHFLLQIFISLTFILLWLHFMFMYYQGISSLSTKFLHINQKRFVIIKNLNPQHLRVILDLGRGQASQKKFCSLEVCHLFWHLSFFCLFCIAHCSLEEKNLGDSEVNLKE